MKTEIFNISPDRVEDRAEKERIAKAADIIKQGGLVAFPTETVYGLGGNATDKNAAAKIYAAKGRPSDNPLIIHVAEPEDAELYAFTNPIYYKLAEAFMPGPLTVILPKKDIIPSEVTGGLSTVALRCPSHPVARELIKAAEVAIAAPSANLSGSPSPTCGEHVINDLNGRIDAIISGGDSEIGLESTIIKLDGSKATLLRPGAITADALTCICDSVEISSAVTEGLKNDEKPLSPGMKYKHYAPKIPLILLDGEDSAVLEFMKNAQGFEKCALICYNEEAEHLKNENIIPIGSKGDLAAQAQNLFSALRTAGQFDADIIYAHLPPSHGLGLALYNRLIRAAAHTVKHIDG